MRPRAGWSCYFELDIDFFYFRSLFQCYFMHCYIRRNQKQCVRRRTCVSCTFSIKIVAYKTHDVLHCNAVIFNSFFVLNVYSISCEISLCCNKIKRCGNCVQMEWIRGIDQIKIDGEAGCGRGSIRWHAFVWLSPFDFYGMVSHKKSSSQNDLINIFFCVCTSSNFKLFMWIHCNFCWNTWNISIDSKNGR